MSNILYNLEGFFQMESKNKPAFTSHMFMGVFPQFVHVLMLVDMHLIIG